MTVLLKTAFNDWEIADLKLTRSVLKHVLQGRYQCYKLMDGVMVIHNPEGAARGMAMSCRSRIQNVFFFGPVLLTGIDQKKGSPTKIPKWVIQKLEKEWWEERNSDADKIAGRLSPGQTLPGM